MVPNILEEVHSLANTFDIGKENTQNVFWGYKSVFQEHFNNNSSYLSEGNCLQYSKTSENITSCNTGCIFCNSKV
jgi:hypothetical protein